jgi:hypothetical protein
MIPQPIRRPPHSVAVPVARCLGLARDAVPAGTIHAVLQKPDGGLHVLAMDGPTALALSVAIRADITAPPFDMPPEGSVWPADDGQRLSGQEAFDTGTRRYVEWDHRAARLRTADAIAATRSITAYAFALSIAALGAVVLALWGGK